MLNKLRHRVSRTIEIRQAFAGCATDQFYQYRCYNGNYQRRTCHYEAPSCGVVCASWQTIGSC